MKYEDEELDDNDMGGVRVVWKREASMAAIPQAPPAVRGAPSTTPSHVAQMWQAMDSRASSLGAAGGGGVIAAVVATVANDDDESTPTIDDDDD